MLNKVTDVRSAYKTYTQSTEDSATYEEPDITVSYSTVSSRSSIEPLTDYQFPLYINGEQVTMAYPMALSALRELSSNIDNIQNPFYKAILTGDTQKDIIIAEADRCYTIVSSNMVTDTSLNSLIKLALLEKGLPSDGVEELTTPTYRISLLNYYQKHPSTLSIDNQTAQTLVPMDIDPYAIRFMYAYLVQDQKLQRLKTTQQ